ncbi:MAG: hypothetical protein ABIJ31_03800 [Pseudomonadota bacterium]
MQDIHGIRPPVLVGLDPMMIKIILMVLAGVLLCALLFFLVRKWLEKRQAKEGLIGLPKPLPPYEAAMKELDRLGMDSMNHPRLFYFNLTLILRKYIGGTFNINASEMTSQEFIRYIKPLNIDNTIKHTITQFQHDTDPIKYAGISPEKSRTSKDLSMVKDVIKKIQADLDTAAQKQQEDS